VKNIGNVDSWDATSKGSSDPHAQTDVITPAHVVKVKALTSVSDVEKMHGL